MKKLICAGAAIFAAVLTAASAYAAEWRTAVEETYEGGQSILNYTTYFDGDAAEVSPSVNCPNDNQTAYDVVGLQYSGPGGQGIEDGGIRANITQYVKSGDKLRISFKYRSTWFNIQPFIEVLDPNGQSAKYTFPDASRMDGWAEYQSAETEPIIFNESDSVRLVLMNRTGYWHVSDLKIERFGDGTEEEAAPFLSDISLNINGERAEKISDGEIKISGKTSGGADIYAALYKDNMLTNVAKTSADGAFETSIQNEGADTMKLFAWDGMKPKAGTVTVTADGISQSSPPSDPSSEPEAIKDAYKDDFLIGSIYNPQNNPNDRHEDTDFILKHFNVLTAENIMKPDYIQPAKGFFTFDNADAMMTFIGQTGMTAIGHTLVWYQQTPAWFTQGSAREVEENMRTHISTVVGRYKGRIKGWDVVNEAIRDDISSHPQSWNEFIRKDVGSNQVSWYNAMGEDYIYKAYVYAHEADPDAELYYNDYNLDDPEKREAAALLVEHINNKYKAEYNTDENLIDAIGMQSHYNIFTKTQYVRDSIDRFRQAGVHVNITELDVCIDRVKDNGSGEAAAVELTPFRERRQAAKYAELMTIYRANADIIDRVTFWGYSDGKSWRRGLHPLMFNDDLSPKQAYYAIMDPKLYR